MLVEGGEEADDISSLTALMMAAIAVGAHLDGMQLLVLVGAGLGLVVVTGMGLISNIDGNR